MLILRIKMIKLLKKILIIILRVFKKSNEKERETICNDG